MLARVIIIIKEISVQRFLPPGRLVSFLVHRKPVANFYSVGAGWLISEEEFMKISVGWIC